MTGAGKRGTMARNPNVVAGSKQGKRTVEAR